MNENRSKEEKFSSGLKHCVKNNNNEYPNKDYFFDAIAFRTNIDKNLSLQTIEELLDRDDQREIDGFPRRIKLGKIVKPSKNNQQVVIVPTTTEAKFYHDDSYTDEDQMGGAGEGEEGEVIGESPLQPEPGQGEGQGSGQGEGGGHDVIADAFDLGKVLTEKFQLPNLKAKGNKRSFSKYTYDLTDRNRRFGQILDKKETLKKI